MEIIQTTRYVSPIGELILGEKDGRLCMCDWVCEPHHCAVIRQMERHLNIKFIEEKSPIIVQAIMQLDEYFAAQRREFDLPLGFIGTEFQQAVWQELQRIPYGTTISYGELARRIGNPRGVRAVARANAINPMSIIVPCHRVIGSDGRLSGYGGGAAAKEFLINLEQARNCT